MNLSEHRERVLLEIKGIFTRNKPRFQSLKEVIERLEKIDPDNPDWGAIRSSSDILLGWAKDIHFALSFAVELNELSESLEEEVCKRCDGTGNIWEEGMPDVDICPDCVGMRTKLKTREHNDSRTTGAKSQG